MGHKRWTLEEETLLVNLAGHMTWHEVAERLGRSYMAVKTRASAVGIKAQKIRNKRGLTPVALSKELECHNQVVYRVVYYLFPRLRDQKMVILTSDEAEEVRRYFIERGLKCKYNPKGTARGRMKKGEPDRFLGANSEYRKRSPRQVRNKAGAPTNG